MFENTIMLAGLGGAAVPVVIHLLGRARYRSVDWGAMMFVAPHGPRWRDGAKLREWALLIVRMAAVGLLAVALARPVAGLVAGATGATSGATVAETRVAAAIVVDCSASMAYEDVGGSRLDRAKAAALQILSTLRRGDRACVIAAGGAPGPTPVLSGDHQSVAARVADLKPAPGAADLADVIATAAAVLDREPERASRQLFVVCDRQAQSWRGAGEAFAAAWSASHAPLAKFAVIPVGGGETDNVSIESLELLNPPAVRGCAAQVKVKVHNYGPSPRAGLPLTLRSGGQEIIAATVSVPAGGSDSVIAPVTFPSAGAQVLTAELRGGGPNLDDRRDCVVDVSPPLRTLIVHGDGDDEDSTLLRAALSPYASAARASGGADLADVREVAESEWDERDLGGYQLIVLSDVESPTDAQAAALEQFVYAGGGLLIAPGPATKTDRYNRSMYREEGGLLPALLQPPTAVRAAGTPPLAIDAASIEASHPMLRFMSGRTGPLEAQIGRCLPITARTPAAHVLASYANGDAFLVESPYGRGRALLVTCGLGREWSTLPLTSFYLPLVQSAARYMCGGNLVDRNVAAGTELVAVFEPALPAGQRSGVIIRPDGSRDTCDVTSVDQRSEARYARTELPGLYTIQVGPRGAERRATFAVAPPAGESDLTPLTEADWKRLQTSLGFTRVEAGDAPLTAQLSTTRGGSEYWLAALAGVMGLLVVELGLTRAWSGEDDKVTR